MARFLAITRPKTRTRPAGIGIGNPNSGFSLPAHPWSPASAHKHTPEDCNYIRKTHNQPPTPPTHRRTQHDYLSNSAPLLEQQQTGISSAQREE